MRYLILATLFITAPVQAFVISSTSTLDYTWHDSEPGDSRTISNDLDNVLFTHYPSPEISDYFADPNAYTFKVLVLEIMFMDSSIGPAFEAEVAYPTGFSFLQTKEFDGRYPGYSGVVAVTDADTLNRIGADRMLTYEITHLSGNMDWIPSIEHNITLEVIKVPEPSSFILACLSIFTMTIINFRNKS